MPSYPYKPRELRTLPFNLYRSQLTPVNPPLVAQAIEAQLAGQETTSYMPQKMTFTKWHTGPAKRSYLSSVLGVQNAAAHWTNRVEALVGPIEAGKGIYTPSQAAYDMNYLPAPMSNFEFNADPIAKGLMNRPVAQAADLNSYAMAQSDPTNAAFTSQPSVEMKRALSVALVGDKTPLGSVFRGLGRIGMGVGAIDAPDPNVTPVASPGVISQVSREAAQGSSSQVVTTVTTPASAPEPVSVIVAPTNRRLSASVFATLGVVGAGLGIYHGWNRTHSTPWTVAWGVAGMVFPIFAVPIMLIQGFGKRG